MSTMRSQDEIRNTVVSLGLPEHPYFMRRTVRAISLLDTGKVNSDSGGGFGGPPPCPPPNFVGDEIFRVQSQFDDTIYHVELNHGNPGCTCADHQKNPGVLCKHMIAATIYSKQAPVAQNEAITIVKTTDGEDGDYWRRCWLIKQDNRRIMVYEEPDLRLDFAKEVEGVRNQDKDGRLFCNCGAFYGDCEHKQLVIQNVKSQLRFIKTPIVQQATDAFSLRYALFPSAGVAVSNFLNECGTEQAKQLQDKMNGQLTKPGNNGNGAQAPSQPMKLDIRDPFQQSEQNDIDQIEGRKNGELAWNINGKYVISYKGIMRLAESHEVAFTDGDNSNTKQVIARARLNGSERISGKLPIPSRATAVELAKRNAARQLLPLVEIKAVEKKAKLKAEFSWQEAYDKCAKLVGGKAQLDCIIFDLVNGGKLRQDNPSHYDRTEWLIIHHACKQDASNDNSCEELRIIPQTNHGDPSEQTPELPLTEDDFVSKCKEAIAKVRDEKKSIEANEQPLEGYNGKRKLQMDKKLRTWLIESDGTKTEISCREICEQFESKQNPSIVTRLRAGIDDGADISIVELDN